MTDKPRIYRYANMRKVVTRLRDDLTSGNQDFVLLYAYNGTGKTRICMEFKDAGKRKNRKKPDTLYFNAFTEDLFSWDNDLEHDSERRFYLNSKSNFFNGLKDLALEERIGDYLTRYADFLFDIDYEKWSISFRKAETRHIKVSRGEENIFIWCLFMALCERVLDNHASYDWVKYIYIDDPVSSLDDNNAIAVGSDLAKLLRRAAERKKQDGTAAPLKIVISSHHALFFNVICNELKTRPHKKYFLHRPDRGTAFTLRATDDTPFFHHVAMLAEIRKASETGKLYTYHFNMLRTILEKTATFFGHNDFSACIEGVDDEVLFARALNVLSHGKYAIHEPTEMVDDTKQLFRRILDTFLANYRFDLPEVPENPTPSRTPPASQSVTTPAAETQ